MLGCIDRAVRAPLQHLAMEGVRSYSLHYKTESVRSDGPERSGVTITGTSVLTPIPPSHSMLRTGTFETSGQLDNVLGTEAVGRFILLSMVPFPYTSCDFVDNSYFTFR